MTGRQDDGWCPWCGWAYGEHPPGGCPGGRSSRGLAAVTAAGVITAAAVAVTLTRLHYAVPAVCCVSGGYLAAYALIAWTAALAVHTTLMVTRGKAPQRSALTENAAARDALTRSLTRLRIGE